MTPLKEAIDAHAATAAGHTQNAEAARTAAKAEHDAAELVQGQEAALTTHWNTALGHAGDAEDEASDAEDERAAADLVLNSAQQQLDALE